MKHSIKSIKGTLADAEAKLDRYQKSYDTDILEYSDKKELFDSRINHCIAVIADLKIGLAVLEEKI